MSSLVVICVGQQVIREEEEPEQFLNHLFSFHQEKESSYSGERKST